MTFYPTTPEKLFVERLRDYERRINTLEMLMSVKTSVYTQVGQVTGMSSGLSYYDVTLPSEAPDANYIVIASVTWGTTWYISNQLSTGFRVNFGTTTPASSSFWWMICKRSAGL